MVTRKRVGATIDFVFQGSYIHAEDVIQYLDDWLQSGLDDRDDLVDWDITFTDVREEEINE